MGEHVKGGCPNRYRVTFLSVIGRLLITIAVILGLFAGLAVVLDDIQGRRPQRKQSRTSPASTHRTAPGWASYSDHRVHSERRGNHGVII